MNFCAASVPPEQITAELAAHGVAGGRGFELINYSAVPEVIVGCGFAAWRTAPPD